MLAVSQNSGSSARRNTRRPRRAMSADQALTRAQERTNSKINAAIANGNVAKLQRNMKVTLQLPTNKFITLVNPDGTTTNEGQHYYQKLGIAAPTVFAYEQPLVNNKWVQAFNGKKEVGTAHDC